MSKKEEESGKETYFPFTFLSSLLLVCLSSPIPGKRACSQAMGKVKWQSTTSNSLVWIVIIIMIIIIINNNTLYYSVKSSSKATQSSLIGDTDHNTGISLLLSTSVWVLLSPPIER